MSERIDTFTLSSRAFESTRLRVAALGETDLDRASVCEGWTVRNILAHLVGGNIRFAQALRGEPADWPTRDDEVITEALRQFDETTGVMQNAIAGIADPSRPTPLQAGEPPAFFAVGVHGADMLVHGWDIAMSTDQDPTLDPSLCAAALWVLEQYPSSFWGPGQFFATKGSTTSDDPQTRLLALAGRIS